MDWSLDIEQVLEAIRQNCVIMSKEHRKRYIYLKGLLRYFKLPVIIISAVNSVVSIGLQPYMMQENISIITCLLALTCGIIGSVELYLGIQYNMEHELLSSKCFYLLSIDIFKTLSLQQDHRTTSGYGYLDNIYKEYIKLIEDSNVLVKSIQDKLTPIPENSLESLRSESSVNNNPVVSECCS